MTNSVRNTVISRTAVISWYIDVSGDKMDEFLWVVMIMTIIMIIMMNLMMYRRGGIFKPEDEWCCSGVEKRGKCKVCKMVGMNKYHRPFRVPVYAMMLGITLIPVTIIVIMEGLSPDTIYAIGVVGVSVVVIPMIFIGLNDKMDDLWKWWSGKDVPRR